MNSLKTIPCNDISAALLREVTFAQPTAAWESFAYAPGESARSAAVQDYHSLFYGARAHQGAPLYENRLPLNPTQHAEECVVLVGKELGQRLGVDPDTVLQGPQVQSVFEDLRAAVVRHISSATCSE